MNGGEEPNHVQSDLSKICYSKTAIVLHWIVALLFLVCYITIYYRLWFTTEMSPAYIPMILTHVAAGIAIGLVAIIRVVWRNISPPPPLTSGSWVEARIASLVHVALYAAMFLMPLTGYLGFHGPLDWMGLTKFQDTALYDWLVTDQLGLTWEEWEKPIDWIHHAAGSTVIWLLILAHVIAALFHHFVRKDNVMARMVPGLSARE